MFLLFWRHTWMLTGARYSESKIYYKILSLLNGVPNMLTCSTCQKFWCALRALGGKHFGVSYVSYVPYMQKNFACSTCSTCRKLWRTLRAPFPPYAKNCRVIYILYVFNILKSPTCPTCKKHWRFSWKFCVFALGEFKFSLIFSSVKSV